jgi:peptidoglycan/LPS O-acetylase OafA/YrhL
VAFVMVFHFVGYIDPAKLGTRILHSLASAGWVGVEIFFVLSGFLITGILLDSKGQAHYFRNFYARRVLRIFPLYYAVLFLLLIYSAYFYWTSSFLPIALKSQLWLWLYAANIPMMTSGTGFHCDHFTFSHFWSLAIEEQFYLVWPIVVLRCSRRQLWRVTLGVFIATFFVRVLLYPVIGAGGVYRFTLCRVDGLALGAFLALIFRNKTPSSLILNIGRATLFVSLVGLWAIALWRSGLRLNDKVVLLFGLSLIAMASGGLLIEVVWGNPAGVIQRAFMSRGLRFLGVYSYGIYVFSGLLRPIVASMIPHLEMYINSYALAVCLYLLISITSSVLLAMGSYRLYEVRFLRLKRHFE